MCGQHNARASAGNTGQNTDKGHTLNPRTEIKILDRAGNRTWATGLEGWDSTDHATATDGSKLSFKFVAHCLILVITICTIIIKTVFRLLFLIVIKMILFLVNTEDSRTVFYIFLPSSRTRRLSEC